MWIVYRIEGIKDTQGYQDLKGKRKAEDEVMCISAIQPICHAHFDINLWKWTVGIIVVWCVGS
jgi:hypothetical protein